ncbi:MAG TPA: phosphatidylserine decarboxylase [Sphingomonas sp.]
MTPIEKPETGGSTVRWRFPAIHPEGYKFAAIAAIATLVLFWLLPDVFGWLGVGITIWVLAFFRDPVRTTPRTAGAIVAPADGLVTMITTVPPPRELIGEGALAPEPVTRVSIFMSVFDVHVNRAPIGGTISRVVYISGKFLSADLDKASEDNERQHILVEDRSGMRIGFTQIAGMVARRIVPFVKPGDIVAGGQRVGLIRFGSRVDVYLPAGTGPLVLLGQRTLAGETVLAIAGRNERIDGIAQ